MSKSKWVSQKGHKLKNNRTGTFQGFLVKRLEPIEPRGTIPAHIQEAIELIQKLEKENE